MQWHRLLQNSHSFLLFSSDTLCILSLLLFLARYVSIVYLLHPQLPACTPIKLDRLTSLPDAWASCVAVAMLTVFHLHRCNEMWIEYSVYVDTETFFCDLGKRHGGALFLRLSPKRNTYTARCLPKRSSVILRDY